ncbi:MAG: bifunctional 5,10-methylenetetrahydrofolate dehydrogenase/5,10-methenyltetrahydrofolate cyclohydrolase [Candidatus Shapirobacteria bacterium]|nr:bifunctional 5,10-methylenetetrahydrofolate dehydrogenase/5,10-methenyltetrahydrofolate cyclohydrolase [Candidatus Shapirobacteria bacterium]
MILLDGKTLSQQILNSLTFSNTSLHVILVGDDPSSLKYVSLKEKKCLEVGVKFTLHHLLDDSTLPFLINQLNTDPSVSGFFIQLPIKNKELLKLISPQKDVDGLNPDSSFKPAVVIGIIKLLENYHLDFANKKIVIINDSDLIGKPLKEHFISAILCNDQTKDLSAITQTADLLISATGTKNIITADMVKDGAVVIDVANGDVDFEHVSPKCSYITPTFGGVGPMTIASLLYNLSLV